eukprot:4407656-Prymnesium_polylepis.1
MPVSYSSSSSSSASISPPSSAAPPSSPSPCSSLCLVHAVARIWRLARPAPPIVLYIYTGLWPMAYGAP